MRDFTYGISSCLFFLGYSLFIVGVSSNAWKFQSGYDFGLWYRCDQRGCSFYEAEFTDYVTVIRVGIAVAAVVFSIGILCLCLEICLKLAKNESTHRRRISLMIDVSTFIAEVIITTALAYYGYRTIKDKARLPHLLWGFAVIGVGIIAAFIGSILRRMGPTRSWDHFICLRKTQKKPKSKTTKKTTPPKKTDNIVLKGVLKGGKRYSKPAVQKKDIVVVKKSTNKSKTAMPYIAPGVPNNSDDSYESLLSNQELSTKAMPHRYEEIPRDRGTTFFRVDHSHNNLTMPRSVLVRRQENQYQISVDRSPRVRAFHTLPPPPTLDPLEDTVAVHSDSCLSFDRQPSTSMHSFVYDWP